jgi:ParB-like chromosome segregation protein Spo0J
LVFGNEERINFMEMRLVDIDLIKLAKYNPRKDLKAGMEEYEKIKMSIEQHGYIDPIIANKETGNIVGGHQRWKVLKDLGYKEIDIIYIDVDLKTEKLLNLALNKIQGNWDMEKLKDVLSEIQVEGLDVELTGFDIGEVEKMITDKCSRLLNDKEIDTKDFNDTFFNCKCPECGFYFTK